MGICIKLFTTISEFFLELEKIGTTEILGWKIVTGKYLNWEFWTGIEPKTGKTGRPVSLQQVGTSLMWDWTTDGADQRGPFQLLRPHEHLVCMKRQSGAGSRNWPTKEGPGQEAAEAVPCRGEKGTLGQSLFPPIKTGVVLGFKRLRKIPVLHRWVCEDFPGCIPGHLVA